MSDVQLCKDCGGEINAGDSHFFFAECVGILKAKLSAPIDALLFCPQCGEQHVDEANPGVCETCGQGKENCACTTFTEWLNPPHKSHRCHFCNHVWRPADVATNGVQVLKSKGDRDGNPRPRYFATAKDFNDSLEQLTEKLRGEIQELKDYRRHYETASTDLAIANKLNDSLNQRVQESFCLVAEAAESFGTCACNLESCSNCGSTTLPARLREFIQA